MNPFIANDIFTNPDDLEIIVNREEKSGKFGFSILRGEVRDFRPVAVAKPFATTAKDAIDNLKKMLEEICEKFPNHPIASPLYKEYEEEDGFRRRELDNSKLFLNKNLVREIIRELRKNLRASTSTMVTPKCEVIVLEWEQSEAGWGLRPDGFSIHRSPANCKVYVEDFWRSLPDVRPLKHSRPYGTSYIQVVEPEIYKQVKASATGVRYPGYFPGSNRFENWRPTYNKS